jgi:hypothetical protein
VAGEVDHDLATTSCLRLQVDLGPQRQAKFSFQRGLARLWSSGIRTRWTTAQNFRPSSHRSSFLTGSDRPLPGPVTTPLTSKGRRPLRARTRSWRGSCAAWGVTAKTTQPGAPAFLARARPFAQRQPVSGLQLDFPRIRARTRNPNPSPKSGPDLRTRAGGSDLRFGLGLGLGIGLGVGIGLGIGLGVGLGIGKVRLRTATSSCSARDHAAIRSLFAPPCS